MKRDNWLGAGILALIAGICVLSGCEVLQKVQTFTESPEAATIETTAKAVSGFLPSPFREGVLGLIALMGFIRNKRHKDMLTAVVDGVGEVLTKDLEEKDAETVKDTLKRVAAEHNVKREVNKFVDKRKEAA